MPTPDCRMWWQAMRERNARTRATLSNIVYDWRERRLSGEVIHKLLRAIIATWHPDGRPAQPPEAALRRVVDDEPGEFLCKGRSIDTSEVECSRVMSAQDLLENNLDPSCLALPVRGYFTEREIRDLEVHGPGRAAINTMRTRRAVAWVTRSADLEEICAAHGPQAPNRVRDLMGLHHVQEDDHLIEVRYPLGALDTVPVAIPTFIEGCPSLIYRSREGGDGWGRTVDLQKLEDGLPEAVHGEVAFTGAFRIRNIGPLRPPSPSLDWEMFLARMPVQWERADFDELEEL